ncbi:hypothetical protein JHK85_056691 [Glycine max]|uniref:uncharacterized protein n=1 Tax=Glycine max TaxID=3847 RepID=UPI001B35693B|nr:uncharacterized protein LOC106797678 [Glycine max]KAG4907200.1 hypothetical protein JHK86_055684 [Glycine max]KAG4918410.1 hypothetical protein JHK85_056691 [Glycine max]
MARAPDNIKSINGSKETLKLVVRITDLWFVGTFNRSEQAEMVITDSHGDAIYVVCKQDQLKSWKTNLMENCIQVRSVLTPGGQGSSQVSGSSQLSSKDAFLSKAEAKTISEISNISEEIVCVTTGSINRIVMDNHSWCYSACSYCYKKTDVETTAFTCACGKHNDQPVLRYRLEVMVNYKEESTKFLLWDCECTELIGPSANEVNKLKIEEGDVDLNVSPQALDKLLGYVLAFKVKVQPKFNNVVVLRYSNDIDLINDVVEMLPDAEAISKVHGPIFDSDNPPMILPNLNL